MKVGDLVWWYNYEEEIMCLVTKVHDHNCVDLFQLEEQIHVGIIHTNDLEVINADR